MRSRNRLAKAVMKRPASATSGKAMFGVERSRSQVMCRTGKGGPNSTHKIPYGKDHPCTTEAQAVKLARQWVAEQA